MISHRDRTTPLSTFSPEFRACVAARPLAAGSASADNFGEYDRGTLMGSRRFSRRSAAALAVLGLVVVVPTSPSHAQAPTLGTNLPTFGVLAGSTVTNTGASTITG